jgi:hypothetical protein
VPTPQVPAYDIEKAHQNLTAFVHEQAEAASRRVGFGWRATELAPATFDDLQREYKACTYTGLPLRVSSCLCDDTIYVDAAGNHAMRFWHDTSHVERGLAFTPDDEMELGCFHLEVLRAHGFEASSIEHRLLHADTIGQTLCVAMLGRFPRNQVGFARAALDHGVDGAIELEARQPFTSIAPPRMWTPPDGAAA